MLHAPPYGRGQALVVVTVVLAVVLVPLGLVVLAVNQERAAYSAINVLVRTAATDGAGVLSDTSVATEAPTLAGSSASCTAHAGSMSAAGQACQTLETGLGHLFPGPYARVDVAAALAATRVSVLNGAPTTPVQDPSTGEVYHYPTVCVSSRVRIGIMEYDGAGLTFAFRACAQTVWRTAHG
jgi:hypothetical protein